MLLSFGDCRTPLRRRFHILGYLYEIDAMRVFLRDRMFPVYRSRKTMVRPAGVWSSGNFMAIRIGPSDPSCMKVGVAPGAAFSAFAKTSSAEIETAPTTGEEASARAPRLERSLYIDSDWTPGSPSESPR